MAENLSLSRMIEHEKTEHALFLNVWQAHHMFVNYEVVMKAHQLCFFLLLVIWLTSAFWTQLAEVKPSPCSTTCWQKVSEPEMWAKRDILLTNEGRSLRGICGKMWQYCITCFQQFLQQHYWTVIARSTRICTHRTHRFTVCRIWVPVNYKILHIPCFQCDEIF